MFRRTRIGAAVLALAIGASWAGLAQAQVLSENFDTVTGVGGGDVLVGSGFGLFEDWDTGITGEVAFGGTAGNTQVDSITAAGVPTGGVAGSGAGQITVNNATFNLVDETFNSVTGTGGGVFLAGGAGPNTFNFTTNWDNGITGEAAFGGTANGAVLNGSMSAMGIPAGGVSGTGAGRLVVDNVTVGGGTWYAGLEFDAGPFPGASALANGGFETGPRLSPPPGWVVFGNSINNVIIETVTPRTGSQMLKMYGNFTGNYNEAGIYQDLPALPGQTWSLHAFARTNSADTIAGGQNYVALRIEFLDASSTELAASEGVILTGASPNNVWVDPPPVQVVAPAGTVTARAVVVFVQPAVGLYQAGSGLVDDVTFDVVAGPQGVELANFSLSADVRGIAAGAGQVLGEYQLRIEDPDGDRLVFTGLANGTWQTIGGALNTAVEADSNGVPAVGVFNRNAPSYNVVVAFDNDNGSPWGTGGTLEVDNLQLGNSDPADSTWFAGLFWDGLVIPSACPDLGRAMYLHADVKGSVPGGAYALRVEAFEVGEAGIDEDFSDVVGAEVAILAASGSDLNGPAFNSVANFDPGVSGLSAYAGLDTGSSLFDGYAISVRTLPMGGNPDGALQLDVDGIIYTPPAGWFAGISYAGQQLASQNLSEVTLTATVKGEAKEFGMLGNYELRIEDAEGDRLYFPMTANGNWQTLGGTLDTALLGPALAGGGDGTFDLDSPAYTVAISFMNETATWDFGGILTIDNIFLTPAPFGNEIGRITFTGVSDGTFQGLGGLLSEGVSTFQGDFDEDFSSASGTGGLEFFNSNGGGSPGGFDDGLTGENSFAGTWGSGVLGSVTAQGCTSCGVGGSGAAQLIIQRTTTVGGGWWAGLVWAGKDPADLTDLSQVELRADVKGEATGPGQTLGTITLRIEDPDLDFISFTVQANGSFQSIGGPLSTGVAGSAGSGDGQLNLYAPSYSVVVLTTGPEGGWNAGGTITVDNLYLTGTSFGDADAYTVTLTFADEVATWGTDGQLTIDNLVFAAAANLDGDQDVDLADYAAFQRCYTGIGGAAAPECGCADLDGDGDVDIADYNQFRFAFEGPK
jgi:hypothetical protein